MKKFQNGWLKFCCFLTGYNFLILSNCSEVSTRKVKKYTAALFIVATLWAFIGFCFCNRYIKLELAGSIVGAIIAVFIIIQIERQILQADKGNRWLSVSRIAIGLLMAILGSLIVDQIIFKDDIEKAKMSANQHEVEKLLPGKAKEINAQIDQLNHALAIKEQERRELVDELNRRPTVKIVETTSSAVPVTHTTTDSLGNIITTKTSERSTTASVREVENPKKSQLISIESQIENINKQKTTKEDMLLNVKSVLEEEVSQKVGFLDELTVMLKILKESTVALIVYIIWLLFLLFLELLILFGKLSDTDSDYDKIIQKQMAIHLRKVELL